MNRILKIFVCFFILSVLLTVYSFADFEDYINDTVDIIAETTGIDKLSFDDIKNMTLADTIRYVLNTVKNNFSAPFKTVIFTYCISMLCCILNGIIQKNGESKIKIIFSVVYSVTFVNFAKSVQITADCIKNTVNFVNLQIPVFASLLTVCGKPATGISFTAGLYSVVQIISLAVNKLFIPLICGCLCIGIVSELNVFSVNDGLISFVKKTVVFLLSFAGTVFSGFLSIKNILASNADGITYKGIKFLISNAVPVVGSSVSESLNSVVGALKLTGSTFAVLFIIAVAVINISSLINTVMWKLSFFICGYISRLFGVKTEVFSSMSEICDIIIAVIVFSTVVLTVSVGIVMSLR